MQSGTTLSQTLRPTDTSLRIAAGLASLFLLPFVVTAWHQALGAPLPRPLHIVLIRLPSLFPLHMASSGAALLLVPLARASIRWAPFHRWIGRLAAVAIGLGGVTALIVASMSVASPAARAGFVVQGVAWLALATAGVVAIRNKHRHLHARLMMATAVVTVAPVLLRLALRVAVAHRWPFAQTYAALAWGSWLVPLTLYALFLLAKDALRKDQVIGALQVAAPE